MLTGKPAESLSVIIIIVTGVDVARWVTSLLDLAFR